MRSVFWEFLGVLGIVSPSVAASVVFTNEVRGVAWATVAETEPYPRKVHILRWHPDRVGMHIVVPSEGRVTVSNIVSRTQALAGVNGSYFDMETGLPTVFLKTPKRTYPGLDWDSRDGGALVWRESGRPEIREKPVSGWTNTTASVIMAGWPLLIRAGTVTRFPETPAYREYHPRTAVAMGPGGYWYWIVVDGRSEFARGMQLQELGLWIKERLDASIALGLDGGGSSALVIRDARGVAVINKPANPGYRQRPVGNALVLLPRPDGGR